MKILIPIKQVPDTSEVKMDEETGTMIREGVESIVNPLDLYAVETALQIIEEEGGEITVLSMGPASAESSLREALSMGCDSAVLLSGREFAGSDTWATSYALSKAIQKLGGFDLVLCGERATDGETGQVGPGIASFCDLPLSTFTSKIETIGNDFIVVERMVETGYERLKLPLPALLTVVKEISYPRLPTLSGKKRAKKADIPVWGVEELDIEPDMVGLKGSPTRVVNIDRPRVTRDVTMLSAETEEDVDAAADKIIELISEQNLLGEGN